MGFPLSQHQPHEFPRVWGVGFLKDKVCSGNPTIDMLKIVVAQEVTRQPAAQVNRAADHLNGVRLSLMKNVGISL